MQSVNTLVGKAQLMLNYNKQDKHVLLGLGKTTAWPVEGSPPSPSKHELSVPELALFIPARVIYGVVKDSQGDIVLSNGETYKKIDYLDTSELVLANAANILITANIKHESLPSSLVSYRAVGIYTNCSVNVDFAFTTPYLELPQVTSYTLDSLYYFSPVYVQNSVTHSFNIVRRFADG